MAKEDYYEVPWLRAIVNFDNEIPRTAMPFVRTKHINKKSDGCFLCGRKYNVTRHHIRKGRSPKAVFLCRKHHDIIHGIALDKQYTVGRKKGQYFYTDSDLRLVLVMGKHYKLYKTGERSIVTKRIMLELQKRESERKDNGNNNN